MSKADLQTERLLVLTGDRAIAAEPAHWQPFESDETLGELAAEFNRRGEARLLEGTPDLMRACACQVVPRLTIGAASLGQMDWLALDRPGRVSILLLDLDHLAVHPQAMARFQDWLCVDQPFYHLIQVSQRSNARSLADYFQARERVLLPWKAVFHEAADLWSFLDELLGRHELAWQGVLANPYDIPCEGGMYGEPYIHPRHGHFINAQGEKARYIRRAYDAYHDQLADIVRDSRDAAIARELNEAETVQLGRGAAMQAFLLSLIAERARRRSNQPVSVQAIGRSLLEMPVEPPLELGRLQETVLVVVQLNQTNRRPDAAQRAALAQLGLTAGVTGAVHFDRPELWRQINMLPAFVSVDSFEAQLPLWAEEERLEVLGLNEASFGITIEESFSRQADDHDQRPTIDLGR